MKKKFVLLNDKQIEVTFKPSDYPLKSQESCRSKLQFSCGELVKEFYDGTLVLEDFPTPEGFYLDFYLPTRDRAIEVQGEQHYKFNNFHYKSEKEFKNAKERDKRKREWCRKNGIELIIVDNVDELRERLNSND
jgi:hypothetical protein